MRPRGKNACDGGQTCARVFARAMPICAVLFPLSLAPITLLTGGGAGQSPDADLVLVIAPPWRDGAGIVARLGGWVVGPRQGAMGTLAQFDRSKTQSEIMQAGAWFVIDASALAAFCRI